MELDRECNLVLSVLRRQDNQWHVITQDFRQPLASFDDPQAACAWAIARAKPKRGRVFVEELAAGNAATPHDRMQAPDFFKFSIPVTWIDGRDS